MSFLLKKNLCDLLHDVLCILKECCMTLLCLLNERCMTCHVSWRNAVWCTISLKGTLRDVPYLLKKCCMLFHKVRLSVDGMLCRASRLLKEHCMTFHVLERNAAWLAISREGTLHNVSCLERTLYDVSYLLKGTAHSALSPKRTLPMFYVFWKNAAWCVMSVEGTLSDVSNLLKELCLIFHASWRNAV